MGVALMIEAILLNLVNWWPSLAIIAKCSTTPASSVRT